MSVTYEVRRSLAGADDWTVVATDLSEPRLRDSGLVVDTAYDYQVRACNAAGCSEWSESVTVTPIDIRYDVRRSLAGQNVWTVIATDLTDTEYLATGLLADTAYDFQVRACYLGACSDWSDIATETTEEGPPGQVVAVRAGVVVGSRIAVATEADQPDGVVAIRSGVVAGSRLRVNVERQVRIRSGVIVGTRVAPRSYVDGTLAPRSGVIVGSRIAVKVDAPVRIRAGVIVGSRAAFQLHRNVAIRSGVIVGARDGYVGPGTGIVVPGQRFTPNSLREGDTFRVVLPWAGLSGMTGLAHVNSRTLRDDKHEQDVDLHITPLDQPNVPALAGGVRPVATADQTDAMRRLARGEREQDRIERDRR